MYTYRKEIPLEDSVPLTCRLCYFSDTADFSKINAVKVFLYCLLKYANDFINDKVQL